MSGSGSNPPDWHPCAAELERQDPDRFRLLMAAPVAARAVLAPLWAFNLEVARAPRVVREPMLALIRLQWWRDAVGEAATGGGARAHPVAGPLMRLVAAGRLDAVLLDALAAARERDIDVRPFGPAELWDYCAATAGTLMWAGAKGLGETAETVIRDLGAAEGLARWLAARPALEAEGRGLTGDAAPLVARAHAAVAVARRERFGPGLPAIRAMTLAGPRLDGAAPGSLRPRLRLAVRALTGSW